MPCCSDCASGSKTMYDASATTGTVTTPTSTMLALTSGAVAAVATGLIYGMDSDVAIPGGFGLRAPLGMAVHVGLSSFISNSYIDPWVQKQNETMISADNLKLYAPPVETGVLTGSLLMLAGDQTVGGGVGAIIGGLSEYASHMINASSSSGGGGAQGNYVGSSSGYGSGRGQSASMYSQKY